MVLYLPDNSDIYKELRNNMRMCDWACVKFGVSIAQLIAPLDKINLIA